MLLKSHGTINYKLKWQYKFQFLLFIFHFKKTIKSNKLNKNLPHLRRGSLSIGLGEVEMTVYTVKCRFMPWPDSHHTILGGVMGSGQG